MSNDEESEMNESVMSVMAPRSMLENRMAIKFILMSTVKKAYHDMLEKKLITKREIASNMSEKVVVVDALMESIDLWSIEMFADMLWGMNLNIAGILLKAVEKSEEENENERLH